jgi:putative FmdB family regulatory protein
LPLYEYRCADCRKRFTVLVGVVAADDPVSCTRCGSPRASRLVSRFSRLRSEDEVLDTLADSFDAGSVNEDDPASVARFMKKMGGEMGEDFGDDFEEAMADEMAGEGGGEAE